jgi:hypothetical protein
MDAESLQKWYTRIIGILFVFGLVPLINEAMMNGNTPELWHRGFYVVLGACVLHFGWDNEKFWRTFCFANGGFFLYMGLFGWIFPNFAGLSAFNALNNSFHTVIGAGGLVSGFWKESALQANTNA